MPRVAPKPRPVMVIWRDAAVMSSARSTDRSSLRICAWPLAGEQSTGLTCVPPGATATTPTCVGAVSVTVKRPGQAWKLVAIVRNRGLYFGLRCPGCPGSLPTKRYMFGHGPAGSGQLNVPVEGSTASYIPLKSVSTVSTSRPAQS